jgi:hypothetical protein
MAWVYSEELKAKTGNGWSDEPEPSTTRMAIITACTRFTTADGSVYQRVDPDEFERGA